MEVLKTTTFTGEPTSLSEFFLTPKIKEKVEQILYDEEPLEGTNTYMEYTKLNKHLGVMKPQPSKGSIFRDVIQPTPDEMKQIINNGGSVPTLTQTTILNNSIFFDFGYNQTSGMFDALVIFLSPMSILSLLETIQHPSARELTFPISYYRVIRYMNTESSWGGIVKSRIHEAIYLLLSKPDLIWRTMNGTEIVGLGSDVSEYLTTKRGMYDKMIMERDGIPEPPKQYYTNFEELYHWTIWKPSLEYIDPYIYYLSFGVEGVYEGEEKNRKIGNLLDEVYIFRGIRPMDVYQKYISIKDLMRRQEITLTNVND